MSRDRLDDCPPYRCGCSLQVARVVVAYPGAPFGVLPHKHFERQVDADGRRRRQQRCPGLRIAEDDEPHRPQVEPGSARVAAEINSSDETCARQERDLRAFAKKAGYKIVGVWKETASGAAVDTRQ
jgi:hypothetical protein